MNNFNLFNEFNEQIPVYLTKSQIQWLILVLGAVADKENDDDYHREVRV